MTFTYAITDYGYDVLRDGVVLISQSSVPGVAGTVPFADDADKRSHAESHVAALTAVPVAPAQPADQPAPMLVLGV